MLPIRGLVLADSGVWIDHLRKRDPLMDGLLARDRVLMHPYILGELALGHVRNRDQLIKRLRQLTAAEKARDEEVANLIQEQRLFGRGLGYVDAHLLASVLLTGIVWLWTRDGRLRETAEELGVAMPLSPEAP